MTLREAIEQEAMQCVVTERRKACGESLGEHSPNICREFERLREPRTGRHAPKRGQVPCVIRPGFRVYHVDESYDHRPRDEVLLNLAPSGSVINPPRIASLEFAGRARPTCSPSSGARGAARTGWVRSVDGARSRRRRVPEGFADGHRSRLSVDGYDVE